MTINETIKLMERVKQHYQEFIVDDYKVEEWHNELKKYSAVDVNKKLEEHLRSEQYGNYIPKVYFLTKNLIKEDNKNPTDGIIMRCTNCQKLVAYHNFDSHLERCNSVIYLNTVSQKYFNKTIDKEKYLNLSEQEFNDRYNKVLMYVLEHTDDVEEQERINNYMIGNPKVQGKLEV